MKIEELYKKIYEQHPSVQTDTRKLKEGDLYFALKGPHFNGNEYAAEALKKGAAYAIVDEEKHAIDERIILVDNVLKTLQQLANFHRQKLDIPFIAITGSNGKTTTKELIHVVLSSTYKTYTTEGNLNNHIGVPLTTLKIKSDAEMAVIEMGANHQKEIASYCTIALPTHGLITNCGKAHLEGFGGVEGVRKGKGELFDFLRKENGTAFIMSDYDYLIEMSKGINEVVQYGTDEGDVVGKAVESDPFLQVEFTKGYTGRIDTNLVGDYNLPNVLAAVTLGKYFSVSDDNIKKSIENYQPSNSRSQLLQKGSNKIILDAYNANPSSMKLAIDNFSKAAGSNKILILGAMAELGEESIEEHKKIVDDINRHQWEKVVLVGGDFHKFDHHHQYFFSSAKAGEWLKKENISNSFILLKGSRSTQMEVILNYI